MAFYSAQAVVRIDSADHRFVPVGETITVNGSGFTNTTSVRFHWATSVYQAEFNTLNDSTLEVIMPELRQGSREYSMFIEAEDTSTVSIAPDWFEFAGIGELGYQHGNRTIVVKAGAILSVSNVPFQAVYVETGGLLELNGNAHGGTVYLEDGATIDFTGIENAYGLDIFHSPDALIIGEPPVTAFDFHMQEVPSISPSYGVQPFSLGRRMIITIIGDGEVVTDPPLTYFPLYEHVALTAIPGPNKYFSGWSGDLNSLNATESIRVENADLAITATFSDGWTLTPYVSPGGSVTVTPEKDVYADGEQVVLTVETEPGYEFLGWEGIIENQSSSYSIMMDANKSVSIGFRKLNYADIPVIESATLHVLPVGETTVIKGRGFEQTTRVRFHWKPFISDAVFRVIDDTTLEVDMPEMRQETRDYEVIVETENGTAFAFTSDFTELSGVQELSPYQFSGALVVQPGAIISGRTQNTVYVKAGGVLKLMGDIYHSEFVVEDGATIDFTGANEVFGSQLYVSPNATVLGELPTGFLRLDVYQMGAMAPSYGIDPFRVGRSIHFNIIGDGHVETTPSGPYYPLFEWVDLLAVAGESSYFNGWSGDIASSNASARVRVERNDLDITVNFAAGWTLTTHVTPGGSITVSPEKDVYADGEQVTLTASVDAGYEFLGWGGHADSSALSTTLTMNGSLEVIASFRSNDYEQLPVITSVDSNIAPAGEAITLSGQGFTNTQSVYFHWASFRSSALFNVVNDQTLEVIMPELERETREHHIVVETESGSTVSISTNTQEFDAIGEIGFLSLSREVVVKPGAILTSNIYLEKCYVESGGILKLNGDVHGLEVFAEDGAIIDFSGALDLFSTHIYHSPDTIIISNPPIASNPYSFISFSMTELKSLRPSLNIDDFKIGYPLNLTIEGPGSVIIEPDKLWYDYGETVSLTAQPDVGNYFIRWIGNAYSREPATTFRIERENQVVARFSPRVDFFSSWRLTHFTTEELADLSISALEADPDGDQITNAAEYAFGENPRVAQRRSTDVFDRMIAGERRFFVSYVRPIHAGDIDYRIELSSNMTAWNHNDDESGIVYTKEYSTEALSDALEIVTVELYPDSEAPGLIFSRIGADIFTN